MNATSQGGAHTDRAARPVRANVGGILPVCAFYTSFPGFGLHRISMGGAYDEHLIRDVGSFYLARSVVGIAGIVARTATAGRVAGLGWTGSACCTSPTTSRT